ncbi:DUF2946 domain-containing protein [Acinetobacter baylyi]|uniref:DUF2946 domain-containing protein n=1 Tax=Acinetobacter baylyi TaxID=202950 RepID=UPI0013C4FD80|nr:DUF2946 domain-containing protein [Acinetobacter baylyi]
MSLGRLLGCYAVLLQIAVFLQPLLPEKYQISPVCETIAQALQLGDYSSSMHMVQHHDIQSLPEHSAHSQLQHQNQNAHHHDINHQCQYCVVYSHVIPLLDFDLKEVLVRIQIRFLAFQENFFHVFFVLQQLFLIPQGRAPPFSFTI